MNKPLSLPLYRLTLSPAALALAISNPKPVEVLFASRRADGKYDAGIKLAQANLLKQLAEPANENLSETLVRLLTKKESV